MRTPQEIKDQEFQVKFRGYDPIEVKTYLDEIADDFFALKEQVQGVQEECESLLVKIEELTDSNAQLSREKDTLEEELSQGGNNVAEIEEKVEKGYRYKDEQIAALTAEKDVLLEEKEQLKEQISEQIQAQQALEESLQKQDEESQKEEAEVTSLRGKVVFLEEQLAELKQEGVDFKSTILVAQQFADELKEKATVEAAAVVAEAKDEASLLQQETEVQRQQIQSELARLGRLHEEVREDLSTKLHLVLDSLQILEPPAGVLDGDEAPLVEEKSTELEEPDVLDEVNDFFENSDNELITPLI